MRLIHGSSAKFLCGLALAATLAFPAHAARVRNARNPGASTPSVALGAISGNALEVHVTAGATGAPAGFSVQWVTSAAHAAEGWSSPEVCSTGFSGNANGAHWNLAPGETVTVRIGDVLYDVPGATSSCGHPPLECETGYVVRVFAHGGSGLTRSDYSADVVSSTHPCRDAYCTYTLTFWRSNGPSAPESFWPVSWLRLGSTGYEAVELQAVLDLPAKDNGLLALAHQLITAKLNVAMGADESEALQPMADAEALIGALVVPPVGSGWLDLASTEAAALALDDYNSGRTGPGSCQ